jgi:dUTP pyrophosphatase
MTVEAGVVDEDYRGEIMVLLRVREAMELKRGWKIAQMVITPYATPEIVEVDELGETERGSGAFGSTDK